MEQLKRLENASSFSASYRVILPSDSGDALETKAKELAEAVYERTEIFCPVFYDTQIQRNEKEDVCEILIGRTNRASSQNALSDWKRDDYACFAKGEDLIIGAVSEQACIDAIDAFCERCLPYADCATLMRAGDMLMHEGQYTFDGAMLNGISVGKYTLVYPESNLNGEYEIAVALRDRIADNSGAYPPIRSDATVPKSGLYIEIGACFDSMPEDEKAYLAGNENRIRMYAPDAYGLAALSRLLCQGLFDTASEGKTASFTVSGKTQISYERPQLTVLNFASNWSADENVMANLSAFSDALSRVNADLILTGAIDRDVWTLAKALVPNTMECHELLLANGQLLPVVARYGVLVNTADSIALREEDGFCLVELHLAAEESEAKEMRYLVELRDCHAEPIWDALGNRFEADGAFAWLLNGRDGCDTLALQAGERGINSVRKQVPLKGYRATLAALSSDGFTVSEAATEASACYQTVTLVPTFTPDGKKK